MTTNESDKRVLEFAKALTESQTYRATITCMNCGNNFQEDIPKGVMIAACDPKCPKCGCSMRQCHNFYNLKPIL